MADVFISYKHVEPDQSLANELADVIGKQHRVFIDSQMPLGVEWGDVIGQNLGRADFLAALVSRDAAGSPMVVAEIEQAHRLNVTSKRPGIIPIRLMFDGELPYPLSAYVNRFQHGIWKGPADTARITSQVLEAIEKRPPLSQPAKQREQIIARVRADWVHGVLERSLYNAARIDLGLETLPAAVERGIDLLIQRPGQDSRPMPAETRLVTVFDEQLGQLLVSGAPGAGKTTLLLELARELLDRAERDDNHPIPVVFNLSSWGRLRMPLEAWMAEELRLRSDVPRALAQELVSKEQILPLLDGLDEVAAERREACVEAINAYRSEHGWVQMVVCSRSAEYEALSVKLRLAGAIAIQPLTRARIEEYVASAGPALEGVRATLRAEPELWHLLETPLMLSIAALTWKNRPVSGIESGEHSIQQRQQELIGAYVGEMFKRRTKETRFTPEQIMSWLSWLAARMVSRSQTVLQVEDVRSSWVGQRKVRIAVLCVLTLVVTVLSGVLGWLNMVAISLEDGSGLWKTIGDKDLLYYLVFMAPIGTILALSRARSLAPAETLEAHWPGARKLFTVISKQALLGGLLGTVLGTVGCASVMGNWFHYGDIPSVASSFGVAGAIAFGLAGLIGSLIQARVAGVRRSANLALSSSLRSAVICFGGAVLFSIACMATQELWFKNSDIVSQALFGGEFFAWMGLFLALEKGGYFLLDHFVTRLILRSKNLLPWNLVQFLDTAAERLILRKVGGSYIFVHRTVLEHFASRSINP